MQLNPALSAPQVPKPLPLVNPAVQASVAQAVVTSHQSAPLSRTQTVHAATATGKQEASRGTQSGTNGGQTVDTAANAINARTNGPQSFKKRGSMLDVSV